MKRLRLAASVAGLVVLVLLLFTGFQALRAKSALTSVSHALDGMGQSLRHGDAAAARGQLNTARQAATRAHHNTSGPGWWLASKLPGIGDDVRAVRTVSSVSDRLTNHVIPNMLTASDAMLPQNLRPKDGRVRLTGIKLAAPDLVKANADFQTEAARVRAIRTAHLSSALKGPVGSLKAKLGRAADISQAAAVAARLLPTMMAENGHRSYLMMFQNNAEARATGGIGGSFAHVTVANGKATMRKQGDFSFVGISTTPVLPLTKVEKAMFQPEMATFPQDVNLTPSFPRAAQLLAAMWQRRHAPIDGVISADPVALSYLLAGTGPVKMPRGIVLNSGNVVSSMLNGVYLHYPDSQAEENSFFQEAAKTVFDAVSHGQGSPGVVLDGLVRAVLEGRLTMWSSHPAEESLLGQSEVTGALPTVRDHTPDVGVYLDDGTGAKMDYYLDASTSVRSLSCSSGQQSLRATLTMKSLAPPNADRLPISILGPGFGAKKGTIRTTAYLYAPVGGSFGDIRLGSAKAPVVHYVDHGRPVVAISLDLAPGQVRQVTADMTGARGQDGDVELRATPGVRLSGVGAVQPTTCPS